MQNMHIFTENFIHVRTTDKRKNYQGDLFTDKRDLMTKSSILKLG